MAGRAKRVRRVLKTVVSVVLLVVVLYAVVVFVSGEVPEGSTVNEVCSQPETVSYGDGSYAVYLREPSLSLSLTTGPAHAVVGRSDDRGVFVELNPSTDPDQVDCRWEADRVEIVEPNGIVHVVPASVFTGGR